MLLRLLSPAYKPRRTMSSAPPLSFTKSTPATVAAEASALIEKFNSSIRNIKEGNATDPFAAFSLALGHASAESARVTLPSMIHEDANVRAESNRMKDELANMFSAAFSDGGLLKVLSDHGESKGGSSENAKFCKDILLRLKIYSGGDTTEKQQSELQQKRKKIEELCTAFCSSINENSDYLLFTDDELKGVDLNSYPLDASGKRKVSLKAPSTIPVFKFAELADTRRKVMEALSKKCQDVNTPRFEQVLQLRHEVARLLSFPHHAAYMLSPKMVGDVESATAFLQECLERYKPKFENDIKLLEKLKKELEPEGGKLQAWDISYYIREYKSRYAGIDEAALQKYFPLEHVKSTILKVYEELLGLKFCREKDVDVWHKDVECYSVTDASTNELQGYFYLDLFPREGKYSHQCVYPLRPSYVGEDGVRVLPACVNLGNLTPSSQGSPSLLLFNEVQTFFHEFGHVMHCVLTNSKHSYHAWAWSAVPFPGGVEQDFLEVPSMMLENFVWQPELLKKLSSHIDDGSTLSDAAIKSLNESRMLMTGYGETKYLAMAMYDLCVHSAAGPDGDGADQDELNPYFIDGSRHDAASLYNVMMKKYTGMDQIPASFSGASWLHLMQGYDAGYYGYMFSECYAADLFSKFEDLLVENKSIIDVDLGRKYRDEILARGATKQGRNMLINFLGRDPSKNAYFNRVNTSI